MRFREVSAYLQDISIRLERMGETQTMLYTTTSINPLTHFSNQIDECIKAVKRHEKQTKEKNRPK